MLTKWSKDTPYINVVNTLYSLRVIKYKKNEIQNLRDFRKTGKGLAKFQSKLGYFEKQLFVAASLNCYKNESFLVDI